MKCIVRIFGLVAILLLGGANAFADESIIRLAAGEHIAPNVLKSMKSIYYSVFDRVGRRVEIVPLPTMRSDKMLEGDSTLDGEAARIPAFIKKHPNLVMVEEPSAVTEFVAYSARGGLSISTPEELTSGKYIVAYPAGNLMLSNILLNKDKSVELVKTWSTPQGLGLAKSGRADVFVDIKVNVEHELKTNPSFNDVLHYAGSPVKTSFHIFLRSEHRELASKLNQALVDMKKEGLYDVYLDAFNVKL